MPFKLLNLGRTLLCMVPNDAYFQALSGGTNNSKTQTYDLFRREHHLCTCYSVWSVVGLPKRQKNMLVGIVVQHFTSREHSKMEPPVLVHEASRLPVPEILQVCCRQETMLTV